MTQSTERTYTAAAGRLAPVVPLPATNELTAERLPQLRIWACYPNGSSPESVEITYDGDGPVTVELVAGIVRALDGLGQSTAAAVTPPVISLTGEALTRALDTRNLKLKGMSA